MSATDPAPVLPPSRTSTKTVVIAAIVVLIAFVSGAFTGILLDHLAHCRRGAHMHRVAAHMMIVRLDRHLDLNDGQRAKIEAILRRRHDRINGMWENVRRQVGPEIEAANKEIEAVLTPEQRAKFQKMRMRLGPLGRHHEDIHRREPTR